MSETSKAIQGYCPMDCGETLFVGAGGHITCGYIGCPDPSAVSRTLADRFNAIDTQRTSSLVAQAVEEAVKGERERLFTVIHFLCHLETCWGEDNTLDIKTEPTGNAGYRTATVHSADEFWRFLEEQAEVLVGPLPGVTRPPQDTLSESKGGEDESG